MKKVILAGLLLTSGSYLLAQTPEDALRYSWYPAQGTARIQAMGGASGSIGGEISTLFTNPANLGFYKTGDAVISGGLNILNNKATYFGQSVKDNKTSGFLGTTGIVLANTTRGGSALKSSAFGIGVSRVADFNNRIEFNGLNQKSSMADMFIEDVNANNGNLSTYGSQLAYNVHWITDDANQHLFSPADAIVSSTGVQQHGTLISEGGITEIAIGGAANLNDNVYLGGSIGMPVLRYRATRTFDELDPTTNPNNNFDGAQFDDYLTTKGMGINLKLGAVFAPVQNFRIGVSAISPTWYSLTDTYDARAWANTEGLPQNEGKNESESRPNDVSVFDYTLQTPYRLMGSLTYLFGNLNNVSSQRGLVTADVEYMNYMSSRFRSAQDDDPSDDAYLHGLNTSIGNAYKGTVNARLGAELKFNTFMARIGGAYYGNPYKDLAGEKGNMYQGTAGVGYRNRGFFIDLGYIYTAKEDVYYPYRLENKNNFDPATLQLNGSRIVLTFGVKI
ncbi:aromatic hydrocarbon degradation protein [Niabella ginsenosidivorans]|uniref:Aromatic hydrocarbon degradation protein n=1 Tax=Niabella ginsenosidivorans TaxID=1176587 RepID=A0A1A9HYU9_9BACT|nr:aromatic hydrocarbon degradation protein [Niabella ginsenosidivorans]ANH79650.1 aromatic hydrocarbon degradation protein [Niabella ginsenosidivorans]